MRFAVHDAARVHPTDIDLEVASGIDGIKRVLTAINNFLPDQQNFTADRSVEPRAIYTATGQDLREQNLIIQANLSVANGVADTVMQDEVRVPQFLGVQRLGLRRFYAVPCGLTDLTNNPTIRCDIVSGGVVTVLGTIGAVAWAGIENYAVDATAAAPNDVLPGDYLRFYCNTNMAVALFNPVNVYVELSTAFCR